MLLNFVGPKKWSEIHFDFKHLYKTTCSLGLLVQSNKWNMFLFN